MQTAADQMAALTKDLEAQLANFKQGPAALEMFDGGRCCSIMFHWLEESSTIAEAKAIARCHGYQLVVQVAGADATLPDDLAAEYEKGGSIFDRWNPEPPEPGLIFAGKHDTEDGDLLVKWLRPLSHEEREQWRAFLQVSLNFSGTRRIALERHRQIMSEHFTPEHDAEHTDGSIALAGGLLALRAAAETMLAGKGDTDTEKARALLAVINYFWPWDQASLKPKTPMRDLERAGALIAAELDRRILHAEAVEEVAAEKLANAVRQQESSTTNSTLPQSRFAKVTEVRAGTRLKPDAGFSCMPTESILTVQEDEALGLFIPCACGRHFLDGQIEGDEYVGLSLAGIREHDHG